MSYALSLSRPDGTAIASRHRDGDAGSRLVFLPGYASDMTGSKASALWDWSERQGRAITLFDYGGCGASAGAFEAQNFDNWLNDALLVIDALPGPVTLIGSSLGGWIAFCAALARPERIAGMIGIAAAPDFTDWGLSEADRARLMREGRLETPSPYGDAPMVQTRAFVESADRHRLLAGPIDVRAPVRLLQGQADPDVPWRIALTLAQRIAHDDVMVTMIKNGDHRLSSPEAIALLCAAVGAMA